MHKIFAKPCKVATVTFTQIVAVALALIILIVGSHTDIRYQYGEYYRNVNISLDETETDFFASGTFNRLFEEDYQDLVCYLAVCKQFEKNGEFDPDATIDLLSYVNRKSVRNAFDSKGALTYRVRDLVNWDQVDEMQLEWETYFVGNSDESVVYQIDKTTVNETYLPVNGKSIYAQDLAKLLIHEGIMDEFGEVVGGVNLDINPVSYWGAIGLNTASGDMTEEEFDEEDSTVVLHNGMQVKITGNVPPKDEIIQDVPSELLEARAQSIVATYLQNAAADLTTNYETYANVTKAMKQNPMLAYCYVGDGEGYTNCKGDHTKIAKLFEENIMKNESNVGIVYDLKKDEVVSHGYRDEDANHTDLRKAMHSYRYSFPENGTLYVAYVGCQADREALGLSVIKNAPASKYEKAQYVYEQIIPNLPDYILAVIVLAIILLLLLLLFTMQVGRSLEDEEDELKESKVKNRKVEASKENEASALDEASEKAVSVKKQKAKIHFVTKDELVGFDCWYTEIAFAMSCLIFGLLLAGIMAITEVYIKEGLQINEQTFYVFESVLVVLFMSFNLFAYASLVRRIKTRTLFSNSLIAVLWRKGLGLMKKLFVSIGKLYATLANKNMLIGVCLPYMAFLIMNAAIILIADDSQNILTGFFIAFLIDMAILVMRVLYARETEEIFDGIERIADGEIEYKLAEGNYHLQNSVRAMQVNRIGEGLKKAVDQSMKDERMKAELITNVSHDIKTPLTSIINYVDLLKRTDITDETALSYIDVLTEKSERLKQLTIDLVEASKISSGNITVQKEPMNITYLCKQAIGEYSDKLAARNLTVVENYPEDAVMIDADPRHMWRIVDNLLGNICKYAMPGTRVYVDVLSGKEKEIVFKNISECELNFAADELTERFIRGDLSRSTEGSGLGLSIAQNLTNAQGGHLDITLDGDLFKVSVRF